MNNAKKYFVISLIVTGLAFTGITPILVNMIMNVILRNPPVDTSGRAAVNISVVASMVLSVIVGMTCAVIGIIKSNSRHKK